MSSFSIEGWRKASGAEKSTPLEHIEFYLNGLDHQHLEQAEEYLQKNHQRGQFHLVAHLQSDGSLVYSNAVLIDQLI